ncbi:MAG: hypothetical protein HOP30_02590 [Cyclobacteriaceae bacterium]|nr:hypothetical protein [Cyclobacteriaceae bacterium]
MKQLVLLLFVLLLISCRQKNQAMHDQVIGVYKMNGFNSGLDLTLMANGKFIHERSDWGCRGGGKVKKVKGSYIVEGDKVTLIPEYVINEIHDWSSPPIITSDSLPFQISDTLYIIKEYTIFTWDSLIYLFTEAQYNEWGYHRDENDYERLANDYNAGYQRYFDGPYFFKGPKKNPPQSKLPIDRLPSRYQKRFLQKPIIGKVLQTKDIEMVKFDDPRIVHQYQINRGRKDGVIEKMRFHGIDGKCEIFITQVDETTCVGWAYKRIDYPNDCKKGCRVSTSWIGSKEEELASLHRLEMMKDPALAELLKE